MFLTGGFGLPFSFVVRTLLLLAMTLVAASAAHALRTQAAEEYRARQAYEDVYYLPSPGALRLLSFGYERALADLIWMRAQVYVGDELYERGGADHIFDYTEAMLALDPDFLRVYRWIGVTGVYRSRDSTLDEVRRAIAIMERGIERFPDEPKLVWDLGATIAFDLVPRMDPSEERRRYERRGVELLQEAARRGEGPDWLVFSTIAQLGQLGENQRVIEHLQEMYVLTDDAVLRAQIEEELRNRQADLEGIAFIELMRQIEAERSEHYPFVPQDFYPMLRPLHDLDALPAQRFVTESGR